MKKYTWIYLVSCVAALAGYLFTNKRQTLLLLSALLLLFLMSWVLWMLSRGKTHLSLEIVDVGVIGQQIPVNIVVHNRGILPADTLVVEIEYYNIVFDKTRRQQIVLNQGKSNRLEYVLPFVSEHCGKTNITMVSAKQYDMLGVLSGKIPVAEAASIIINPKVVPLDIQMVDSASAKNSGDFYDTMKKGSDSSEIFELRDYHEGDNIRSIHWKLSGKLDKMIVKEYGNPVNYQTAVFYDMNVKTSENEETREAIQNAILQMTASICMAMVTKQYPFHMIAADHGNRYEVQVNDKNGFLTLLADMMCRKIPATVGEQTFQRELLIGERRFTRIIYICGELDEMYLANAVPESKRTIIALRASGVRSIDNRENQTVIQIPIDYLQGKVKAFDL